MNGCTSYISGLTLSLSASTYSVGESDGSLRVCILGLRGTGSTSATATIATQDISATSSFIFLFYWGLSQVQTHLFGI